MGRAQTDIRTVLSVEECAEVFKSTAEMSRGLGARLMGILARLIGNDAVSFYTPTDDSPFADFEDAPSFIVGCRVARVGSGGAAANMTDVQMTVWDRGTERDVTFISEFKIGGGKQAKDTIARMVNAFKNRDVRGVA